TVRERLFGAADSSLWRPLTRQFQKSASTPSYTFSRHFFEKGRQHDPHDAREEGSPLVGRIRRLEIDDPGGRRERGEALLGVREKIEVAAAEGPDESIPRERSLPTEPVREARDLQPALREQLEDRLGGRPVILGRAEAMLEGDKRPPG